MASSKPHQEDGFDDEPAMLDADDALEEVNADDDVAMDSDNDEDDEEIVLVNDSIAYFDAHRDSVFAIAQHPVHPSLIATGGGEGPEEDAPGKGYVFDTSAAASRPVLPASYSGTRAESTRLEPLFHIDGHSDSINALAFTQPAGDFLVSAGLDGRVRVYRVKIGAAGQQTPKLSFVAESQEVPEVNWLAPCPAPSGTSSSSSPSSSSASPPSPPPYPANTFALGASDGSVWVYTVDPAADPANPLQMVQSYFLHTAASTAGAWTPDGALLVTVAEDSSLHAWDVWGAAAARGLVAAADGSLTAVSLTAADGRFAVDGGLYSVAVDPRGALAACGGAGGAIRIVGLPRLSLEPEAKTNAKGKAKSKAAGDGAPSQAGAILAALQVQAESVETLAFAPAPQTLLAAGSVDGSVAVFDTARSFAVRRHVRGAHGDQSVVRLEFVRGSPGGWCLTSCGMDGVVRRWDLRGATASSTAGAGTGAGAGAGAAGGGVSAGDAAGLLGEWRGHRGGGEGGGVLGFVQGEMGERVVTAGDDGVVLVFEA